MSDFINSFFNIQLMLQVLPNIFTYGLVNTLIISLSATALGILIGLIIAVMAVSGNRVAGWFARVYTDILRGLPAILTILLIGSALAQPLYVVTGGNPYLLAIIALSLISGAYIGEIFRASIQSIDKGQMEASRALGMSYGPSMRLVVVPQAVRQVLPSLMNQFIGVVKDSSLVYVLGLLAEQRDLFRIGQDASINFGNLSPLVVAGCFYLVITIPLTHVVNVVDRKMRIGKKVRVAVEPAKELTTGPSPIKR
ncbi:amino acid ABC transporter permease [Arthrobacter sp. NPDC080031]|uniref:amino acid ABC transporter permease n=1 Tax=Arthrobacter sp. NPDC080031 TaxID=3155918 RepID=UPI00344E8210